MTRPLILVPLADQRLLELRCSVDEGNMLLVGYDASLFIDQGSGSIECRFKTEKAELFLEQLAQESA
jgi:hypothetical protein